MITGTTTAPRIKPRELRRRVVLPARMRTGAGWSDAFILDVSSRGLQIHASRCAAKGDHVELWRANRVITAKVIWKRGARAGLHCEERVPVEEILSFGRSSALQLTATNRKVIDRRAAARRHGESRIKGRAIEFISIAAIAATLSSGLFLIVLDALARPLAVVHQMLGG